MEETEVYVEISTTTKKIGAVDEELGHGLMAWHDAGFRYMLLLFEGSQSQMRDLACIFSIDRPIILAIWSSAL